MNSKQTEEMDKVIKFLALELPEPVWNDVNKKWQGFKSGYAAAPQKGMKWVKASERLPDKKTDDLNDDIGIVFRNVEKTAIMFVFLSITPNITAMLQHDLNGWEWLDESPSPSEAGDGWISVEQYLPGREDYYEVKFEDGTIDEKPFRIRYSKNILGFMTESKVAHWRPLLPRQNKLLNTIK